MTDVPMVISSMVESGSRNTSKTNTKQVFSTNWNLQFATLEICGIPLRTKKRNLIFGG